MSEQLKAIEILESLLLEVKKDIKAEGVEVFGYIETNIEDAIAKLKEHEQNFKQKEFDYRTECQDIISKARIEADNMPDRLAELEKVILDYYLGKGYQIGVGHWEFKVFTASVYKEKGLKVIFFENFEPKEVYKNSTPTTKEMWDKAIAHFSTQNEEIENG